MNKSTGILEKSPCTFFMSTKIQTISNDELLTFSEVIDRLERAWYAQESSDSSIFYPYTPWPIDQFIRALEIARENSCGDKYLEIGCGIGTKLIFASFFGFKVHGIDIRPQYIATAKYLCPEATLEVADARFYSNYGFDVVYSYRPIIDDKQQEDFEEKQTSWIKPGTILIAPSPVKPLDPLYWESLVPAVWKRRDK